MTECEERKPDKILNLENHIVRELRKQKPPFNWEFKIFILRSFIKHKPKNEKFNCILPKLLPSTKQSISSVPSSPQMINSFTFNTFFPAAKQTWHLLRTPLITKSNHQIQNYRPHQPKNKLASRTRSQTQTKLQTPASQSLIIHFKSKPLHPKPTFSTPPKKKRDKEIPHLTQSKQELFPEHPDLSLFWIKTTIRSITQKPNST